MAEVRYAALAEDDLDGIASYTVRAWGIAQAERYMAELEAICGMLARQPESGRWCDAIASGLWRAPCGKHVVFYRPKSYGIRVVRVLHEKQLPELHEFERDE